MESIEFKQLPLSVRFAVGVSFFSIWNLFEWFVINKYLHQYLPFYVVGDACVWDVGVAMLIAFFIWRLQQNERSSKPMQ